MSQSTLQPAEKLDYLQAKFIQIAVLPAVADVHPMGMFALDERGRVWDYDATNGEWRVYPTERRLPK